MIVRYYAAYLCEMTYYSALERDIPDLIIDLLTTALNDAFGRSDPVPNSHTP